MNETRKISGIKVVVSNETYNKYKGTLEEQLEEKDKEITRLNNIIDELEECFGKNYFDFNDNRYEKMKKIFERR